MALSIQHDRNQKKFFAIVDEKECLLSYSISPDQKTLDYYSTYVPQELRGRRIGEDIVKFALEYAKNNQLKVNPSCPFVKRIIDRHPQYRSLL